MISIDDISIGSLWIKYLDFVLQNGKFVEDDKEPILEGDEILLSVRSIDYDDQIIKRYADPDIIDAYSRKMFSLDIIPEIGTTYGPRLFAHDRVDQIEWMVRRLKKNPFSKSATISLLKPGDSGRVPCLIALSARVRENVVILDAVFRSQNAFKSYGNFFGIDKIHALISKRLNLEKGKLVFNVLSPHIYKSDLEQIKTIIEKEKKRIAVR